MAEKTVEKTAGKKAESKAVEKASTEVRLAQGVSAEAAGGVLTVSGPLGKLQKGFDPKKIGVEARNGAVVVSSKTGSKRRDRALVNAVAAHAKNMAAGVTKVFEKKLAVVFAHFPISIEAKGGEVLIKNFIGEKLARHAAIVGQTKVAVSGQEITVSGSDKEDVGQTAANIIQASKIREKDERVFQDGVYHV
ncbi:MAG: 50S ribosomal protein L6 [Candidatus Micrarchaeota archaeon]|nr:50S ribosomal protein L6 [Candidatus Micrarchaeota archaeon]